MIQNNNFRILTDDEKAQYKFCFCELCRFYECELIEEYIQFMKSNSAAKYPTYNPSDLKDGCIMKKCTQVECGRQNVTEGIGDAYRISTMNHQIETRENKWEPKQPVFISAQTGSGKNYFIENTLLPYVRQLNIEKRTDYKVLIISNRIALNLQIKNRIKHGEYSINNEDDQVYYNYKNYECATVINYQGFLNRSEYFKSMQGKSKASSRYLFVVCDEAHFFTSDAMFIPETKMILSSIVEIFSKAIRIYMSATPYECLEYIQKEETKQFVFYHFKREYNYLDVMTYSDHEELIEKIANSGKEKWLIFIDHKKKCKELKEVLEKISCGNGDRPLQGKVFTLDADSKYNSQHQYLVNNEKYMPFTRVIISTSVIDNGVNLRDIDNVVISDTSKAKCLQMLGRARVGEKKISLYVKRFDEKYIEDRIDKLMEYQNAYHKHDLAYGVPKDYDPSFRKVNYLYEFMKYYDAHASEFATTLFGRYREQPHELYANEISRSLVNKHIEIYQAILLEMHRTNRDEELIGQKFLEHQLSWFGKTYNIEDDISIIGANDAKKKLIDFLESYIDKRMFVEEQKGFREQITRLIDEVYKREDPNTDRVYGASKMNGIFESNKLDYQIETVRETTGEKRTFWIVRNK